MERIRVLQLIPDLGVGGAEKMLLNLVLGLKDSRFEVRVVSMFPPRQTLIEHELASACVPVVHLGKHLGFDGRMFARIHCAIREWRPHIIHTHRAVLHYALPAVVRRARTVVHTVHNLADMEVPWTARAAHRLMFAAGASSVAIGDAVAKSFAAMYGLHPRRTIPHGIPVAQFARSPAPRSDWRAREGVPEDVLVLACVARLSPQKNLGCLLEAFARIEGRRLPWLVIAGEGPLRADLELRAKALGVGARVRFLGARRDVAEVLRASDIFVLSSEWEGNPLCVMEAMAAGLPVVSTRVGGVPELVRHDETGVLVSPGDANALSAAIQRVLRDAEMRASMGLRAAAVARQMLDISTMVLAYANLYEGLLKEGEGL
jgi:glycosyltransferase involved in cell wall biosynthesis